MDNNFDEKNFLNDENNANTEGADLSLPDMNDAGTGENGRTVEHVISYREGNEVSETTVGVSANKEAEATVHNRESTYHMTGDMLTHDRVDTIGAVPDYSSSRTVGDGNISYAPADKMAGKRKRKSGFGGKVVLVAVCILLSLGCGFVGAYFGYDLAGGTYVPPTADSDSGGDVVPETEAGAADDGETQVVVVDRVVEHVETSSDGSTLTYADVEALVGDSVVAITTEHKVTSLWQEYVTGGAGSGVIMSEDGYIITNNHVIATEETSYYGSTVTYADKITVSLKNGNEYEAEIIGGDAGADIAVIKIEPDKDEKLVTAKFADSDKLKVGEEVIAIGNPLGELSGTTTNGIISALARKVTVENVEMNLLQTNAAINPGNSGGGLFNMSGELVGVVNAKSSGEGIEGLGFAIPSNDAYETSKAIIENGGSISTSPASVKIGITLLDILTVADARKYGVNALGIYVYIVEEGYNDDVLKKGDRIIAVNDEEIALGEDVVNIVRNSEAGDTLKFVIYRDGKVKNVDVTVFDNTSDNNVDF